MSPRIVVQLRRLLAESSTRTPSSEVSYSLAGTLANGKSEVYVGTSRDRAPTVLVPLESASDTTARLTSGLAFWASSRVEFAYRGRLWAEPAAIIECRDPALLDTFAVMLSHLVENLPAAEKPSWKDVSILFDGWERLLRRRRVLGPDEELGLWGELRMMVDAPRIDEVVSAWQGPEAAAVDFVLSETGFEVKATRRSGVHFVSQTQVTRPIGELVLYFIACDVVVDPVAGRSIVELSDVIGSRCSDVAAFEKKLLSAGFSRGDAAAYHRRFLLTRPPWLFPEQAIPRVRTVDPGVSDLRYRVELDPERALSGESYRSAMRHFSPEGAISE